MALSSSPVPLAVWSLSLLALVCSFPSYGIKIHVGKKQPSKNPFIFARWHLSSLVWVSHVCAQVEVTPNQKKQGQRTVCLSDEREIDVYIHMYIHIYIYICIKEQSCCIDMADTHVHLQQGVHLWGGLDPDERVTSGLVKEVGEKTQHTAIGQQNPSSDRSKDSGYRELSWEEQGWLVKTP